MPRPQSTIWQYFSVVEDPDKKGRKAACSFCGHQQACGVTRLHQHLLNKCPRIPAALRSDLQQKEGGKPAAQTKRRDGRPGRFQQTTDIDRALSTLATQGMSHVGFDSASAEPPMSPSPRHHHQGSPNTTSGPANAQDSPASSLDWYLARALFSAGVPFTVVDNPHFASFLKHMRPGYAVPRPFQLRQHILKEQHWDLIEMPAIVESDTSITRSCSPTTAAASAGASSPSSSRATISRTMPSLNDRSPSAATASQTSAARSHMCVPPELDGSL